ncbi:MAG: hypothetical protein ACXIU8_06905 [Alkalilacustris sp.]
MTVHTAVPARHRLRRGLERYPPLVLLCGAWLLAILVIAVAAPLVAPFS